MASGSSLYTTLEKGKLFSLEAGSYKQQWVFPAADDVQCGNETAQRKLDGLYSEPAVANGKVYFGAYDGAVYALEQDNGTCLWRFESGDPIVGGVVLGEQGLYVPSSDGYLYLLNPDDGSLKEKFNVGTAWSTPLLTDDAIYVSTMDGELWKLSLDLKSQVWSGPFTVDGALLTPPTPVGDSTILVGGIGKALYAVSTSDGTKQWEVTGKNWFWGTPTVDGTTVYATTLGGEVKKIDGTNGNVAWTYKTLESVRSSVVLAGGFVVAVDNSGKIYRLKPDTTNPDGEAEGAPSDLAIRNLAK